VRRANTARAEGVAFSEYLEIIRKKNRVGWGVRIDEAIEPLSVPSLALGRTSYAFAALAVPSITGPGTEERCATELLYMVFL